MMKIRHCAAAAALAAASLASTSAMAQVYLAGDIGNARVTNLNCSGTTTCDKSDTAFLGRIGYGFGNGLGLELGYANYGKARVAGPGFSADLKASAVQLGAAFQLPLASEWGLNFRLGAARVKAKASASDGVNSESASETNTKPYFGFGVNYGFTKQLKGQLGIESTKSEVVGNSGKLRTLSLGLRYQF